MLAYVVRVMRIVHVPERSYSPLHTAVENGFADIVDVLLVADANIEAKERNEL